MGINLKINNVKHDLAQVINTSQLPISVIKMIVNDIFDEVTQIEKKVLEDELKEEQEAQEKQKQENENNENKDNENKDNENKEENSNIVDDVVDAELVEGTVE